MRKGIQWRLPTIFITPAKYLSIGMRETHFHVNTKAETGRTYRESYITQFRKFCIKPIILAFHALLLPFDTY